MTPPSSKASLLLTVALAGLLCCALVGFAWWKSAVTTERVFCRVCAAAASHKTLSLYGRFVRTWDTTPVATDDTRNYFDRYLGYPHGHEWALETDGFSMMFSSTGDPNHKPALTHMAYQLVAASGIREPERRRSYFESIIQPTGRGNYTAVMDELHRRSENFDPPMFADRDHKRAVFMTWREIARQIPPNPESAFERIWGPEMEQVRIPDYVRAGGLMSEEGISRNQRPVD